MYTLVHSPSPLQKQLFGTFHSRKVKTTTGGRKASLFKIISHFRPVIYVHVQNALMPLAWVLHWKSLPPKKKEKMNLTPEKVLHCNRGMRGVYSFEVRSLRLNRSSSTGWSTWLNLKKREQNPVLGVTSRSPNQHRALPRSRNKQQMLQERRQYHTNTSPHCYFLSPPPCAITDTIWSPRVFGSVDDSATAAPSPPLLLLLLTWACLESLRSRMEENQEDARAAFPKSNICSCGGGESGALVSHNPAGPVSENRLPWTLPAGKNPRKK